MKRLVNGKIVEMTASEITKRNEEAKAFEVKCAERKAAKEAKDKLKASAKTKLMAGEALTEEEADELLGGNR